MIERAGDDWIQRRAFRQRIETEHFVELAAEFVFAAEPILFGPDVLDHGPFELRRFGGEIIADHGIATSRIDLRGLLRRPSRRIHHGGTEARSKEENDYVETAIHGAIPKKNSGGRSSRYVTILFAGESVNYINCRPSQSSPSSPCLRGESMPVVVERARPAMGSLFQLRLIGDDAEHLADCAETALDEIERVERLLSWRDVRSETARVNREAATRPVLVDFEFAQFLATIKGAEKATAGFFDAAVQSRRAIVGADELWEIEAEHRLVRFTRSGVRLDFGAVGKGYALDCAAAELRRFGVSQALLDAGTSSVLALGADEFGNPWPVGLRNPFTARPELRGTWPLELGQLRLGDLALSCSASHDAATSSGAESDLLDPATGRPVTQASAYAVVATNGIAAEVLSTALCAMGTVRAEAYTKEESNQLLRDVVAIVRLDAGDDASAAPCVTPLLLRRSGVLV
ncbi:MAG: hypothetical protein C0483_11975 [Pirellula sp.]|nr:hypothetical protein [Pirellula sp.]